MTKQTLEVKKTLADGSHVKISVPVHHSELMEFYRTPAELFWEELLIKFGLRRTTSQPQLYNRYCATKNIKFDRRVEFPRDRFF